MFKNIWFSDLIETSEFSTELLDELGKITVKTLAETIFNPSVTTEAIQKDNVPRILFFSFNFHQETASIIIGKGLGILNALQNAYEQLIPYLHEKKPTIIKLDVATHVKIANIKKLNAAWNIELTIHGIAFSKDSGLAFLPDQIFQNALMNQNKKLKQDRVYRILTPYPLQSAHYKKLMLDKEVSAYTFQTKGILIQNTDIQKTYRGQPYPPIITTDNLGYRIKIAAHYLSKALYTNGRFNYLYRPHRLSNAMDYNILRHAGSVYALFEYYEYFKDDTILPSAMQGLNYLLKTLIPSPDVDGLCIAEEGFVKLGGTALACIALAKYIKATGNTSKLDILLKMGSHLLSMQKNNGRFKPQKYFYLTSVSTDFESIYYPGETILAFLRIYQIHKDPKWLEAATKGATWLITVRDKGVAEVDLPHDHWLLYGLNELYQEKPEALFLEHTLKICSSIFSKQITKDHRPDWIGGFYNPPRSTPASTRGEGLSAAYCLLKNLEHHKNFSEKILDSYQKIILFQYGMQYMPESSLYFLEPYQVIGAVHTSHTQAEIRIDFVQHALSSFIGYYKIMTARKN